jgi:uncharacterized protein with PhoU and TrkA domain
LRQGDAVAPLLFNVVLVIAIRRSQVETKGTIFDKCNQIMAYADDVVIMGGRIQDVKETFTLLVEQTNKQTNKQDGIRNKWEKKKLIILS